MRPLFIFFILAGCGYRWQPEFPLENGWPAISVPYVLGDADGSITTELVRALVVSGVKVQQWGTKYQLQVSIVGAEGQTIGYRRDRQQISGESQKNLIASERRKTIAVNASLISSESKEVVAGPFRVESSVDFDYVDGDSIQDLVFIPSKGLSQIVVLPFSLGQLESSEAAEEAAMRPLYLQIAKKIVDSIFRAW